MNIIDRVKNILISPKTEWEVIEKETTEIPKLLTGYLLLLAIIPAVANFIGFALVMSWFNLGIRQAIMGYVSPIIAVFVAAFVINLLADSFGSKKDFRRAFQLVMYSYTPAIVAGVFMIIPSLGILASLAGLYGLYLLYIGMKPMMQTPDEKVTGYFVVSLLVMIVASLVVGVILSALFLGGGMMAGGF